MTLDMINSARRSSFYLKSVILIPFVGLTFIAVGLVGYLSFRNGQEAVHHVATQWRNEINRRIEEHLDDFMGLPGKINAANAGREGALPTPGARGRAVRSTLS